MDTTEHGSLVDTDMAGNGYHGRCEYCDLPLVTDLGYTSWSGTKCKPRPIQSLDEVPQQIQSYAQFKGMRFRVEHGVALYIQPYGKSYTLEELQQRIDTIKIP